MRYDRRVKGKQRVARVSYLDRSRLASSARTQSRRNVHASLVMHI